MSDGPFASSSSSRVHPGLTIVIWAYSALTFIAQDIVKARTLSPRHILQHLHFRHSDYAHFVTPLPSAHSP